MRRIVTLGADPALSTALSAFGASVIAILPNESPVSGMKLLDFTKASTSPALPRTNQRSTVRQPLPGWTPSGASALRQPFKPMVTVKELFASNTRMRIRTLQDGVYRMPSEISEHAHGRIFGIEPEPEAEVNPEAIRAIAGAQLIVLGPGPFFAGVLATLAAPRIAAALVRSRATILFFANHASEGVSTDGMALPCYVRGLREHVLRWAGSELGKMTVVAHGERATWSAIDSQTRLRRVPLMSGHSHAWAALAEAAENVVSGVLPKRALNPIEPRSLYESPGVLRSRTA